MNIGLEKRIDNGKAGLYTKPIAVELQQKPVNL